MPYSSRAPALALPPPTRAQAAAYRRRGYALASRPRGGSGIRRLFPQRFELALRRSKPRVRRVDARAQLAHHVERAPGILGDQTQKDLGGDAQRPHVCFRPHRQAARHDRPLAVIRRPPEVAVMAGFAGTAGFAVFTVLYIAA